MNVIPSFLRGCVSFLILSLNTTCAAIPVFAISLFKLVIPVRSWRTTCSRLLNRIAEFWINCNELWLPKPNTVVWENFDPRSLKEDESCLITSNHQSWADIFLVQHLLNQKTPQIKFFLKQELVWVPIIGLCWWALDFPFMKRYSKSYLKKHPEKKGKDQETTIKACAKFRGLPVAIYNFMEGTRFTEEKRKRQQSPYRNLLKPRVGAAGIVLSALGDQMRYLLNITFFYRETPPGFWGILSGRNGGVTIVIEKRDIPAELVNRDYGGDSTYRSELLQWINELWKEKDQLLDRLKGEGSRTPDDGGNETGETGAAEQSSPGEQDQDDARPEPKTPEDQQA